MPGLVGSFSLARGTGAIDPQTGAKVPDQMEYKFRIDYRPPLGSRRPSSEGLGLPVRGTFYDREGTGQLGRQIHVILNWGWNTLAPGGGRTRGSP